MIYEDQYFRIVEDCRGAIAILTINSRKKKKIFLPVLFLYFLFYFFFIFIYRKSSRVGRIRSNSKMNDFSSVIEVASMLLDVSWYRRRNESPINCYYCMSYFELPLFRFAMCGNRINLNNGKQIIYPRLS